MPFARHRYESVTARIFQDFAFASTASSPSERRVVDRDMIRRLMVGFRNILVHDYTRLDPAIVLRVLRIDLLDLDRFRRVVLDIA